MVNKHFFIAPIIQQTLNTIFEKSVKQKYDLMGRKIDGYDVRKGLYIEMKGNDSAGKLKVVK